VRKSPRWSPIRVGQEHQVLGSRRDGNCASDVPAPDSVTPHTVLGTIRRQMTAGTSERRPLAIHQSLSSTVPEDACDGESVERGG